MQNIENLSNFVEQNGGQRKVAKLLKCSHSYLSEVLSGKKGGKKVLEQLDFYFINSLIQCPVLGDISKEQCKRNHTKKFVATNSMNGKLQRACSTCMQKWRV